jgi:hypothetical protein
MTAGWQHRVRCISAKSCAANVPNRRRWPADRWRPKEKGKVFRRGGSVTSMDRARRSRFPPKLLCREVFVIGDTKDQVASTWWRVVSGRVGPLRRGRPVPTRRVMIKPRVAVLRVRRCKGQSNLVLVNVVFRTRSDLSAADFALAAAAAGSAGSGARPHWIRAACASDRRTRRRDRSDGPRSRPGGVISWSSQACVQCARCDRATRR